MMFLNILDHIFGDSSEIKPNVPENLRLSDVTEANYENLYEHFDVREMEMIEGIRRCVETDEKLKLENWQKLNLAERQAALQGLENRIAAIESRSPMRIVVEDMDPHTCGYTSFSQSIIAINASEVRNDSISGLRELVDTIVHEGRHAYQYQNVFIERTEQNENKFMGWVNNFMQGYLDQKTYGYEAYRTQPLEADAWAFAAEVVSNLSFR